eukprot:1147723-Pelagomonas_calceolata.AAC.3
MRAPPCYSMNLASSTISSLRGLLQLTLNPPTLATHARVEGLVQQAKFGSKDPKSVGFDFPSPAHGTAPIDTNFISVLLKMPLLGPGPGGAHSGDFAVHLRTTPACH